MKSDIKKLQDELIKKGYLSIVDVMLLSQEDGHLYDTYRNYLEPKRTPFAKKHYNEKGHISGWEYVKQPETFNHIKELELLQTKLEI